MSVRDLLEWIDLILSAVTLAGILAAAVASLLLGSWRAHRSLRRLAAGVTQERFDAVLGAPAFVDVGEDGLAYRTYVDDRFLVIAVCESERVVEYAVTSRSTSFRPKVPFPHDGWSGPGHPPSLARIGRTTFADALPGQFEAASHLMARRFGYVEWAYLANPGNYQTIGIGISDGVPTVKDLDLLTTLFASSGHDGRSWSSDEAASDPDLDQFRRSAIPNMYVVTAPGRTFSPEPRWPGADQDHVRALQEASSWRARRRRRRSYGLSWLTVARQRWRHRP